MHSNPKKHIGPPFYIKQMYIYIYNWGQTTSISFPSPLFFHCPQYIIYLDTNMGGVYTWTPIWGYKNICYFLYFPRLMPLSFLSHGVISPHHFSPSRLSTIDAFLLINLMYIIYITWPSTIIFNSWPNSHIYITLHIWGSKSGCYIPLPIIFSLSSVHIAI
jgi:hypothetical protein